eukprot:607521-Amorphochlora_amoeboformis.AAC.1
MVNHMPRVHTAGLALWIVFLYVFPMTARAQIETASHQNFGKQVLTLREKQVIPAHATSTGEFF